MSGKKPGVPLREVCIMCGMPCPDKLTQDTRGWYGFTGFMDETANFCPDCWRANAKAVDELRALAHTRPIPPLQHHHIRILFSLALRRTRIETGNGE